MGRTKGKGKKKERASIDMAIQEKRKGKNGKENGMEMQRQHNSNRIAEGIT